MANILCVDDEPAAALQIKGILQEVGHQVVTVHNVEAALNVLGRGGVDLIISDYRMPVMNGMEFLARLKQEGPDVPLIMVTGHGSIEHAVAAIKAGASDYVTKPIRAPQLELVVDQVLEFVRLRRENNALRQEVSQLRGRQELVGESAAFRQVMDLIETVAPTRATVLLEGESGTGKELFSRALHSLSDRSEGPFVSVNCAAMPEQLVESMLFGHEKGAFTGAVRQVRGAFERANRGTLLLDEVSEMRLDLQAKLLRVLQEQEFERVGGTSLIRVDVRVVATTNRDLAVEVRDGNFREDLYYRLNVVPIYLPPLRNRVDDIPLLAQRFVQRIARELGKTVTGISPEAIELLRSAPWPGNVRELSHAIERAIILSSAPVLQPEDFDRQLIGENSSPTPSTRSGGAGEAVSLGGGGLSEGLSRGQVQLDTLNIAEAEGVLIERALEVTNQNRTRAAELLGISVRTLRNRLNARPSDTN